MWYSYGIVQLDYCDCNVIYDDVVTLKLSVCIYI
jgi:hypothetical protein